MQRTKTLTPPTLFTKFCHVLETGCPYNFKTIADILVKLDTNKALSVDG